MNYTIVLKWSDEDQAYLATVPELGVTTHGNTLAEALDMVLEVIELNDCDKNN